MADKKAKPAKKKEIRGAKTKFDDQVSESSRQYLRRQAKDPYVKRAKQHGFRSRAAYKLIEMQEKYNFIKPGMNVVDLGAAPGGWCQVLKMLTHDQVKIIAIDKIYMDPIEGVNIIKGDFSNDEVYENLLSLCPKGVDIVLSDMAPETSGHSGNDHLRIMSLAEMAADFALNTLRPGGSFACKLFQGGEEAKFRDEMRKHFNKVQFVKPESSRKDSREMFIFCQGKTVSS